MKADNKENGMQLGMLRVALCLPGSIVLQIDVNPVSCNLEITWDGATHDQILHLRLESERGRKGKRSNHTTDPERKVQPNQVWWAFGV